MPVLMDIFLLFAVESSELHITLVLLLSLCIYTSSSAETFRRDGQHGVNYAHFVKNPSQRLNAAVLASLMVSRPQECTFQCLNHQECYSVNFAAVSVDGRYACELLNSDKFKSSGDLVHTESFDHYNIKVSKTY